MNEALPNPVAEEPLRVNPADFGDWPPEDRVVDVENLEEVVPEPARFAQIVEDRQRYLEMLRDLEEGDPLIRVERIDNGG